MIFQSSDKHINMTVETHCKCDIGRNRKENQDRCAAFQCSWTYATDKIGWVAAVADGMGGHYGGAVAAELAIQTVRESLSIIRTSPEEVLQKTFLNVFDKISGRAWRDPQLATMGCTLSIAITDGVRVYCASIGDSRVYRIRDNGIFQISRDHSLVQELLGSGQIKLEDVELHPSRNILTRALTASKCDAPDIYEPFELCNNDSVLVCSDGLWNMLSDESILSIVKDNNLKNAIDKLIDEANAQGGEDNIAIAMLRPIRI